MRVQCETYAKSVPGLNKVLEEFLHSKGFSPVKGSVEVHFSQAIPGVSCRLKWKEDRRATDQAA